MLQTKELNNGRLAMLGIAGFTLQELVPPHRESELCSRPGLCLGCVLMVAGEAAGLPAHTAGSSAFAACRPASPPLDPAPSPHLSPTPSPLLQSLSTWLCTWSVRCCWRWRTLSATLACPPRRWTPWSPPCPTCSERSPSVACTAGLAA